MAGEGIMEPGDGANAHTARASSQMMPRAIAAAMHAERAPLQKSVRAAPPRKHKWVVRLLRREGPGITRMLWRLLGREADVMDAYQDCFCKLAARGKPDGMISARAYAYRTATNIAIEMIRVRRRREAHLRLIGSRRSNACSSEQDGGDVTDSLDRLREAIARLPVHLRNVVVLRDLGRMPYAQVAKILGIEPPTARVYRRHAVVRLTGLLNNEEGEA